MKNIKSNGLPETFLSVPCNVEAGVPVDEIDCALSRADAVISMVMMALGSEAGRPADHVLTEALWCAQGQLALIRKMTYHAHATTKAISSSAIKLAAGA